MDSQSRKEAAEIKKLPISLLEYLPAPRWRSLSALIVVVILLLIFAGYTLNTNIRYARLEAELDRHESLWESKEISGYEYNLRAWAGEGYSKVYVKVEDGVATSEELEKGDSLDINSFDTVPDLFNRISKALREKEEKGFNQLSIRYNGDIGYPTYIALRDSYKAGDPGVYSYSIIDFKILEQGQTAK